MPEQTFDNTATDAALESVAAETQRNDSAGHEGKARASKTGASDSQLANLEQQIREANERALRSHAELENFRKRSQRELAEERRYAIVPFARDLLAVVDNLERAIEAAYTGLQTRTASSPKPASASDDVSSLLQGVQMVAAQLEGVLKSHQCIRIDTVGAPFDPNLHQAIAQEPSDQYSAGIITRATQSGYTLEGRVIRPAQVFVSTGPGATNQS